MATHNAQNTASARFYRVRDFMNGPLKEFSIADNVRSIPSLFDGLKASQRKALWGMLKRGENADTIQVERVAAYIAAETDYHHGTGSMEMTIVGMANFYAGSNNMPLFAAEGQFASRLTSMAASPRYIETKLSAMFRKLFKKEDDLILHHHEVEGRKIEPQYFIPILPTVLINGAQGTGTGHACLIMSYNPDDLRDHVLKLLDGKKPKESLTPWFRGFRGKVERNPQTGQIVIEGIYKTEDSTTIHVGELPIGIFLDDYKEHLEKLEDAGIVKDWTKKVTQVKPFPGIVDDEMEFTIRVPRSTTAMSDEALANKLKMFARDTENFTLWNEKGVLERFESAEAVVERFVKWRLERYEERRQALITQTKEQISWLSEKLRFILYYLEHVNDFKNKRKPELFALLEKNNFENIDDLLRLPIYSLTRDEIEKLKQSIEDLKRYLKELMADTAIEMYRRELKNFNAYK